MKDPDGTTFAIRIAATLFFVGANVFFVAAEFALVKGYGSTSCAAAPRKAAGHVRPTTFVLIDRN